MKRLTEITDNYREAFIFHYRQMIANRYDYQIISTRYSLPDSITSETILSIKKFFMEQVYPPYSRRLELDQSFETLQSFLHHPVKIMGVLGNAAIIPFRYGFLFPKALHAGKTILNGYISANNVEKEILSTLKKNVFPLPVSEENLTASIRQLDIETLKKFVIEIQEMLGFLFDDLLTSKTIQIIKDVVKTMKNKTKIYTPVEVKSVETGLLLLENGSKIFSDIDPPAKEFLLELIGEVENQFIDEIFSTL